MNKEKCTFFVNGECINPECSLCYLNGEILMWKLFTKHLKEKVKEIEMKRKALLIHIKKIIDQKEEKVETNCECGDGYMPNPFGHSYHVCRVCGGTKRKYVTKLEEIKKFMLILEFTYNDNLSENDCFNRNWREL